MKETCSCGHPRLAHLEEQRTDIKTGKVTYQAECCYCGCNRFEPFELPAPTLCDDEDFTGRPS